MLVIGAVQATRTYELTPAQYVPLPFLGNAAAHADLYLQMRDLSLARGDRDHAHLLQHAACAISILGHFASLTTVLPAPVIQLVRAVVLQYRFVSSSFKLMTG